MLQNILLVAHFFVVIILIFLILIQKSDGDSAFSSNNSLNGAFTPRGQANLLTKATSVLMTLFAVNCIVLARMYHNDQSKAKESVIDQAAKKSVQKKEDTSNGAQHNTEKNVTKNNANDNSKVTTTSTTTPQATTHHTTTEGATIPSPETAAPSHQTTAITEPQAENENQTATNTVAQADQATQEPDIQTSN